MNRGRVQAQGNGTEKSSSWASNHDVTKGMGLLSVDGLIAQLEPAELHLRTTALQKSKDRINSAPSNGVIAVMKKSYYDDFRNKKVRVDIEVNAGTAFIDNPNT
jgi:hypothetical protein